MSERSVIGEADAPRTSAAQLLEVLGVDPREADEIAAVVAVDVVEERLDVVGDLVDLERLVVEQHGLIAVAGDTVRLFDLATGTVAVERATVLLVDETGLTVAVPETEASRLLAALGAAGVVPAITGSAATPGW